MISIEERRKVLGKETHELSDEDIIKLRKALYVLCERVLDKHFNNRVQASPFRKH